MIAQNIIIYEAGILALLLGVGYSRYRLKQRNNRLLEIKQAEINEKNEHIESMLKEKEWLIREVHHRVKNNLQIVMSLLSTQSLYLSDEAAVKAIQESQNRMQAISLIHQKLYKSDNVSSVCMGDYIRELINYLRDSYHTKAKLLFETDAQMQLDVSQAIPVSLILNEAITNAIKYAFTDEQDGIVTVSLKQTTSEHITLTIADNGIGPPDNVNTANTGSLGMSLIKGLVDQLGGSFYLSNNNGLSIEVSFPCYREIYIH